ncbi:hypothetical protein, partial [uncultured Clostridium sp.]|uniref:hypothetical protein n=1 Tax=uncultured Clostridium sp. TaxID=59620 RepID=UPI0027DE1240
CAWPFLRQAQKIQNALKKNRRLKDFIEFKLLYSIGFIFYRGLYHSRLGDFFIQSNNIKGGIYSINFDYIS